MDEPPPRAIVDCAEKKETDKEKEAREAGKWQTRPEDVDPGALELRPRVVGPPVIRPFKLDSLGPDYTMAFLGKRREGKSFLMRHILYSMRDRFPRGYVFTKTKINGFWQKHVPEKAIFDGYSPGIMEKIWNQQLKIVQWMDKHPDEAKNVNPYIFVVLEDCMSQDLAHTQQLSDIFYNGRHLKICLFISLQYAKGIPPGFRENIDMCFCFRMHSVAQIEAVCENFLGHIDKKTARNVLETVVWKDQKTGARQFLAVDNSGNSDIDEMLYAGQAKDPGPFKLCCREMWEGTK